MKGNIFIKRPVMAMSIAIMILLVGAISYFTLPLESYPDIAPPTVQVSATYTGASADAVQSRIPIIAARRIAIAFFTFNPAS